MKVITLKRKYIAFGIIGLTFLALAITHCSPLSPSISKFNDENGNPQTPAPVAPEISRFSDGMKSIDTNFIESNLVFENSPEINDLLSYSLSSDQPKKRILNLTEKELQVFKIKGNVLLSISSEWRADTIFFELGIKNKEFDEDAYDKPIDESTIEQLADVIETVKTNKHITKLSRNHDNDTLWELSTDATTNTEVAGIVRLTVKRIILSLSSRENEKNNFEITATGN